MKQSAFFILIVILLLNGIILCMLVELSPIPNKSPNGFKRRWLANQPELLRHNELNVPFNYICGIKPPFIYITVPNPQWLIRLDTNLVRQDTIGFGLPFDNRLLGANYTAVDPPNVYYFAGNMPAIYRGQWNRQRFDTLYKPSVVFTRSIFLPPNHVVLRILNNDLSQQCIQKINIRTKQVEASLLLFEDQENGGFDKDGLLRYDSVSKKLFYIEQFRNRFYCLDSTLSLVYSGNTIDTFHYNPVDIEWREEGDERRLAPIRSRYSVNGDVCIANGFLYIISKVKSDNESFGQFKNNAVIDRYRILNGEYSGSFHLPLIKSKKLKSFMLFNNALVALYDKRVAIYKIKP